MNATARGPLAGIKVLELGTMYAAPTAGRMLRDFGADVVKVEDPQVGDFARQWVPQKDGLSLGFSRLNAGKKSLGIDLRSSRGREIVLQLAADVDVVLESFRPGRLESWGLGYDQLSVANPGLILARVSGFGQTGPNKNLPGFGTVAETASGFAHVNGWPDSPPTSPPFGFADSIAGMSAAMGVAMALYKRGSSKQGDIVDVALYEPLMFIIGDQFLRFSALNEIQQRIGNATGAASPRGIYEAQDGKFLSIAASNQGIAKRLFAAMDRPWIIDDPRFATNAARLENNGELQEMVKEWVHSMPQSTVLMVLEKFEVVCAPVNDAADVIADPHFQERTLVEITGNEIMKGALMPGPVLHLSSYSGPTYDGVPAIGEHTAEILGTRLGLTDTQLTELSVAGVISARN